jgi:hypothetical protein
VATGAVYTERFLAGQGVIGFQRYNVPYDRRAVIKCATAVNYGDTAAVFSCSIGGRTVIYEAIPGGGQRVYTELTVPAYGSEFIQVDTFSGTMAYSVSGFLLSAAGQPADPPDTLTVDLADLPTPSPGIPLSR